MTDDSGEEQRIRFSYGELRELPDPVQRYFKFCMAEGQPRIKYCHIKQQGHFRYAQSTSYFCCVLLCAMGGQSAPIKAAFTSIVGIYFVGFG